MKSPILPVSLPPEIHADVVKLSAQKNIAVSEFIRLAVVEKLSAATGKKYILIPWGGRRAGAGRKPVRSDRVHGAVAAAALKDAPPSPRAVGGAAKKTSRAAGA